MQSEYLIDIEQHLIGLLLNAPEVWSEVNMIANKDFSKVRHRIIDVIRQQLDVVPQGSVSPVILADKLKSYSVTDIGGVDPLIYLNGIERLGKGIKVTEGVNLLKALKLATVKRELLEACDEAKREIQAGKTLDDMVGAVDKTLSGVNTNYFRSETSLMFEGFIDDMEQRRETPIKAEEMGFQGPFPSMNATLGSLVFPASLVVVGARTGGSKSALGFFYNTYLAERYGLTVLHLDANEMPRKQIIDRAACCFSKGEIPLWAVKSGEWGQNKEWLDLWRGTVVPKIRKIEKLMHYQNIGKMQPREVVSFIKRFYFKHVGRGNHLLISLDYLKGASHMRGGRDSEHQIVGDYVDELKGMINEDITASIWTSVQQNRGGIVSGKKVEDIVDSEGNFALSDRIIQQATDAFSMRYKVPEELGKERNLFGNIRLEQHKGRDLIGKQAQFALMPVKIGNKFVKNYYNLNTKGFSFEDKGDLRQMVAILGHVAVDLGQGSSGEKIP